MGISFLPLQLKPNKSLVVMKQLYNDLLQEPLKDFNPLEPENTFKLIANDLMREYLVQKTKI